MTDAFDLARRFRLSFDLVEAHAQVLSCQERVRQEYPDVLDATAALNAARAHLVEVQRRYDQLPPFPTSYGTTLR